MAIFCFNFISFSLPKIFTPFHAKISQKWFGIRTVCTCSTAFCIRARCMHSTIAFVNNGERARAHIATKAVPNIPSHPKLNINAFNWIIIYFVICIDWYWCHFVPTKKKSRNENANLNGLRFGSHLSSANNFVNNSITVYFPPIRIELFSSK